MIEWINSHGVEALLGYYIFISVLGTMPDLPTNASYMQRWAFGAAHAICGNVQKVFASLRPNGNGNGNGNKPKE